MIKIRKGSERGHFNHGWLDTYHTFSFADYHDPNQMGFRTLQVLNEDRVQPGQGFETHSHKDMEILTYVLAGAVEHKDSMGNVGVIRPGEIQRMTAGTGVTHSEYNPSKKEPLHLLQIWILPEKKGLSPSYEQRDFSRNGQRRRLILLASPDGQNGSVKIHQDAYVYTTFLDTHESIEYNIRPRRGAWVQVARGGIYLNQQTLTAGDGAGISEERGLRISASEEPAELLLFDVA